jgi:hypothetical protein
MDHSPHELAEVNWRAKHPRQPWQRALRWAPLGMVAILLVAFGILKVQWPDDEPDAEAVGVVTALLGEASVLADDVNRKSGETRVEAFVNGNATFETGAQSGLGLALVGSTRLKVGEQSRVAVNDERSVVLERGAVWLDVGRGDRPFQVSTDHATVTVFGTTFTVETREGETIVTVSSGQVMVDSGEESRFLQPGEQLRVRPDKRLSDTVQVEWAPLMAWAGELQPEARAEARYRRLEAVRGGVADLPTRPAYWVHLPEERLRLRGVTLLWEPDARGAGHCAYDMILYDGRGNPIAHERVPADVFAHAEEGEYTVTVEPEAMDRLSPVLIELIPDRGTGSRETDFTEVRVLAW